jgi:hypothetical protein
MGIDTYLLVKKHPVSAKVIVFYHIVRALSIIIQLNVTDGINGVEAESETALFDQ